MDILAIVLACSLHADDRLVTTLVDVQSSGNPFFVGDLKTLKTNDDLHSAADALRFAEDLGFTAVDPRSRRRQRTSRSSCT